MLPLSATTTSPSTPASCNQRLALATHTATVSASLRHGRTTVSSSSSDRIAPPVAISAKLPIAAKFPIGHKS